MCTSSQAGTLSLLSDSYSQSQFTCDHSGGCSYNGSGKQNNHSNDAGAPEMVAWLDNHFEVLPDDATRYLVVEGRLRSGRQLQ